MDPITISDKNIELTSSAKLVGFIVSKDLKWNPNTVCMQENSNSTILSTETCSSTMEGLAGFLYNLYTASRRTCMPSFPSCFAAIFV